MQRFYFAATDGKTKKYPWQALPEKQKKSRAALTEPHPVKRTEKKYKVFPASSHSLLAAFYAARPSSCYSIGVNTPSLRCTRLVL